MNTPKAMELVRGECSNYDRPLVGCMFTVRGKWAEGECAVDLGVRCQHFEGAVLPLVDRKPQYAGARNEYMDMTSSEGGADIMLAPERLRSCACGAPLAPRKRLCDTCRRERSLEAKRSHWAKLPTR